MTRMATTCTTIALGTLVAAGSAAAQSEQEKIDQALSAAPPQLQDRVAVHDLDGTVLREGDSEYVCYPAPEAFAGPMCLDSEWRAWFDAYQNQEDYTPSRLGIAYMMAGDSPDGGASNIEPYDREPTDENDWVVEGPHVMILEPDQEDLANLPDVPHTDEPYVMWKGTPYAHIMLPVGARPPQRPVD